MIPVVRKDYYCTVRGSRFKFVECAQCTQKFVYQMIRVATGRGSSPFCLFNEDAQARAENRAQADLETQLATGCDPVPCPKCGWYQVEMVTSLREHHHEWMYTLSLYLFIPATICAMLGLSGVILSYEQSKVVPWFTAASPFVVGAFSLIFYRRLLAHRLDPNAVPLPERLGIAAVRAEPVEDFDQWLVQNGIQEPAPQSK